MSIFIWNKKQNNFQTRKSSCVNARGIPPARGRKMLTPPPHWLDLTPPPGWGGVRSSQLGGQVKGQSSQGAKLNLIQQIPGKSNEIWEEIDSGGNYFHWKLNKFAIVANLFWKNSTWWGDLLTVRMCNGNGNCNDYNRVPPEGGSVRWIACELMNLNQV